MDDKKNKTTVRIGGIDYVIVGVESADYIQRVATFVDHKIHDTKRANPMQSSNNATVLAAVNIADELLKLREEYDKLDAAFAVLRAQQHDAQKHSPMSVQMSVQREAQLAVR